MSDQDPILCPVCQHNINAHEYEIDFERYFCGGTYGDCICGLSPSEISRFVLEIERRKAQ